MNFKHLNIKYCNSFYHNYHVEKLSSYYSIFDKFQYNNKDKTIKTKLKNIIHKWYNYKSQLEADNNNEYIIK